MHLYELLALTIHSLAWDALQNERQDPQNTNNPIHPYVPFNISRLKRRSLSRMWKKSRRSHEVKASDPRPRRGSWWWSGSLRMSVYSPARRRFGDGLSAAGIASSDPERLSDAADARAHAASGPAASGTSNARAPGCPSSLRATSELFGGVPSEPNSTEPSPVRSCRRVAQ